MISRKRLPRLVVQLVCFLSASVMLWPVFSWKGAGRFALQLSPFVAICSTVAVRSIGAGAGIGFLLAVLAMVRPRFFCRYACPTGLLLEGTTAIGFQKNSWWRKCPSLGKYAALLILAGAAIGYPVLLWMDPISIFSSFFAVRTAATITSGLLSGLGLSLLVFLSFTSGVFWCARLCPLGGTQELLASVQSIGKNRRLNRSAGHTPAKEIASVARRAFMIGAAGVGLGFAAQKIGAARGENAPLRPPGAVEEEKFAGLCLRCGNCARACPSRIIQPYFELTGITGLFAPAIQYRNQYCLEDCHDCMRVCPSGALELLDLEQKRRYVIGEALVEGSLCLLALGRKDCDACERACPFDAVHTHWDEEKYVAYPMVQTEKCNGCGACEVACPTEKVKAIRVWKRPD